MSTISHGMDLAAVEELGRLLQAKSDQLRHLVKEVEGVLGRTLWQGPDATAFTQQWWPEHRVRLQGAAERIHGFGQSALNNASEQRSASEVGGVATAPSTRRGPEATPPVANVGRPVGPVASPGELSPGAAYTPDAQGDGNRWNARGGFWMDDGGYAVNNCTSWAYFRRTELGLLDRPADGQGHGWQWGVGPASSHPPTLGAAVSSPPTTTNDFGHVMVVEGISNDGTTIRVSEMNRDGRETGVVTYGEWVRVGGTDLWTRAGGNERITLTFRQ